MALNRDSGGGVGGTPAAAVAGLYDHKGGYNAATNTPDLDTAPSGVLLADAYTVTAAGTFFTELVEVGDVLIADQDDPTLLTHWTRVQANVDAATTTVRGLVELATDGESAADVVVQGDDARMSDARTPLAHTHPNADLTQVPGDGIDTSAIHDDAAGEILAVDLKAVPAGADVVLIEDTADSNNKKRTTAQAIADLGGGGGLGYNVCFGAEFSTVGFFARANGSGGDPEESSIGPRAELTIPKAGTFTALAYMTNSGSATTVIKIHVNSIVVETITLTGTDDVDTSVSTAVVAGDTVAIEYDASTNPGRSNFQLYIE